MLRRFQHYFSYIAAAGVPVHAFLGFFLPLLHTVFLQSNWLLFHISIIEAIDSGEKGTNPVAMTIINPRKQNWPEIELATCCSQVL